MSQSLLSNARLYASKRRLDLAEALGSGKDGIVLVTRHQSECGQLAQSAQLADSAIKALHRKEAYLRERGVYERPRGLDVVDVVGFNVPQMTAFDDELMVLEMTIVRRPFVLDFAGAHLDHRPEFPHEVWMDWEAQFEERWPTVKRVIDRFEDFGIYLLDVSAANISFRE